MPLLTQNHDYQYLPIQCPRCGHEGKIRISKLNSTFQCKSCKGRFYVDPDGVVSGERPPEEQDEYLKHLTGPLPKPKPTLLERLWAALPRAGQYAVGGGVAIVAFYFLTSWLLGWNSVELPESAEDRAVLLVKFALESDRRGVRAVSLSGTSDKALRWAERAAVHLGGKTAVLGDVRTETLFRDRQEAGETVGLMLTVSVEQEGERHTYELMTFWLRPDGGVWSLDGDRTYDVAPKEA